MDLSLNDDLARFDGMQDVTYIRVQPAGEFTVPVQAALRRAVTIQEMRLLSPQLALTPHDVVWHLNAAELAEWVPAAGDRIADHDQQWIVLAASQLTLASRWRLYCRRAR